MPSIKSPVSRQAFWESHVHAWQNSGLSKARFCREHQLSYHQFIYWIPKICPAVRSDLTTTSMPKFLPVAVEQQTVLPELQAKLPNGIIISGITKDSVQVVGALLAQL